MQVPNFIERQAAALEQSRKVDLFTGKQAFAEGQHSSYQLLLCYLPFEY